MSPLQSLIRDRAERRALACPYRVCTAFRVLNGPADGAPEGLALDRYAEHLVLWARARVSLDVAEEWGREAMASLSARGVVLKILDPDPRRSRSLPLAGAIPDAPVLVREEDASFLCDLDRGLQTGLFLDQRETRLAIRDHAKGKEVLNLFAYTCSFSVHAALGGALRVTSVDLSKKALRRGRENMQASGLDPDRHRWFPDEVLSHLERAGRRGDHYGLVLVDPPSVGRAGGRTFSLRRDVERLLALAFPLVEPRGVLLVASHVRDLGFEELGEATEAASAGRPFEVLGRFGLPAWDHPVGGPGGSEDRGDYLTTLVLRAG